MPRTPFVELELSVILQALEQGSASAFAQLYAHYADKVRYAVARAAFRRCRVRDVDELNQEVWCRLLDNERRLLRRYDASRGRFGPFIGTVAYQQALVAVHRYRRQVPSDDVDVEDDSFPDDDSLRFAEDLVTSELFHKLLVRVDAELGEGDRMLLREIHLNRRTCRSVASQLGVSENTVYKRKERLNGKLRRIIDELLGTKPRSSASELAAPVVAGLVAVALLMQSASDVGTGPGSALLSSPARFVASRSSQGIQG